MNKVNEFDDIELDIEALGEVSGGTGSAGGGVIAYCKACNCKLKDLGPRRIDGGTTNIFICVNSKCREYNKEKNNLEVNWP